MKKQAVYGILSALAVLAVLAAVLYAPVSRWRKKDPVLKSLYKQLTGARDVNEIYNLFNAMIKHCFHFSLKASSRDVIRGSLPDPDMAARVADIVGYMESSAEKEGDFLKGKIKSIYISLT